MKICNLFLSFLLLPTLTFAQAKETPLLPLYEAKLTEYPASVTQAPCVKTDYFSSPRLKKYKKCFSQSDVSPTKVNFAGQFRLLKCGMSMGSLWEIVACKTGQSVGMVDPGDVLFSAQSKLVVRNPSGPNEMLETYQLPAYGLPELLVWEGKKLKRIPNSIQRKN